MTGKNSNQESKAEDGSLEERHVVTSFLERDNMIILLKRSSRVSTYVGRWAGVSGTIDPGHTPEEQARIEIAEEIGLTSSDISLIKTGEPLEVIDRSLKRRWIIHPFRFVLVSDRPLTIDWEHVELRWVTPAELELGQFETVPGLAEAWRRVQ